MAAWREGLTNEQWEPKASADGYASFRRGHSLCCHSAHHHVPCIVFESHTDTRMDRRIHKKCRLIANGWASRQMSQLCVMMSTIFAPKLTPCSLRSPLPLSLFPILSLLLSHAHALSLSLFHPLSPTHALSLSLSLPHSLIPLPSSPPAHLSRRSKEGDRSKAKIDVI